MGAQKRSIGAARVDVAVTLSTDGPPEIRSEDDVAWLRHVSTMRELAFLLGVDAEGINGLMADYLAESENLFALLTKMAEGGQLDRPGLAASPMHSE